MWATDEAELKLLKPALEQICVLDSPFEYSTVTGHFIEDMRHSASLRLVSVVTALVRFFTAGAAITYGGGSGRIP